MTRHDELHGKTNDEEKTYKKYIVRHEHPSVNKEMERRREKFATKTYNIRTSTNYEREKGMAR